MLRMSEIKSKIRKELGKSVTSDILTALQGHLTNQEQLTGIVEGTDGNNSRMTVLGTTSKIIFVSRSSGFFSKTSVQTLNLNQVSGIEYKKGFVSNKGLTIYSGNREFQIYGGNTSQLDQITAYIR